jgi:hypothetical protein
MIDDSLVVASPYQLIESCPERHKHEAEAFWLLPPLLYRVASPPTQVVSASPKIVYTGHNVATHC